MSVILRAAVDADYDAFTRFFLELAIPDPVPSIERWRTEICAFASIVVDGSNPIGYASWLAIGDRAHVRHVIVDPSARGRGLGRMLMDGLAVNVRAAGFSRWQLYVKDENVAARRLYERCGMHIASRSTVFDLKWDRLDALPRSRVLRAAAPRPAFGVSAAMLDGWLRDPRKEVVMLVAEDGMPAGIACFDAQHPGARPCAVDAPDALAPLLEALRPHRRPEHDSLRLVLEDQAEAAATLEAAGASPLLRLLRYEGAPTT